MGIVALWPHSGVNPSSSAHSVSCGSEDVIVPLPDRRRCPELQCCLSNNDSRVGKKIDPTSVLHARPECNQCELMKLLYKKGT